MSPQKIYSVLAVNEELWFGGQLGILIYNTNRDYWRILDESKINLKGSITTMTWDSNFVWIGSNYGISRINPVKKRVEIIESIPPQHIPIATDNHVTDVCFSKHI